MKIKELAKEEEMNLKLLAQAFMHEVEIALSQIKGESIRLFLPENDQYRLLRLRIWRDQYSVDLKYILSKLLPFWQQFVRKRTKRIRSEGLGVRVGTLTGKKSDEMLRNLVNEDFPTGQNELLHKSLRQEEIIAKVFEQEDKHGIKTQAGVSRGLFDFPNPKGYLQYYKRRMRKQNEEREKVVDEMIKRPYRGNPFL